MLVLSVGIHQLEAGTSDLTHDDEDGRIMKGYSVNELSAYYAPKQEIPESRIDRFGYRIKLLIVAGCVLAEIIGYIILIVHYGGSCGPLSIRMHV